MTSVHRRAGRLAAVALLAAALLSGISPGPAGAAVSPAARLLENPGFENGLTSWTATTDAVTAVTGQAHTGAGAAQINDGSDGAPAYLRAAPIAVVPGEELTATAWMSRLQGSGGSLYVEFNREDGSRASAVSVDATAATGWQQLTVTGIAPDDAATAVLLEYSKVGPKGVTVWDDAAVTAIPPSALKVPNAGFEEVRDKAKPTAWTYDNVDAASLVHGSAARTGDGALQTKDDSSATGVGVASRQVAARPGQTVTASVWLNESKAAAGQQIYLEFRAAPATGAPLGAKLKSVPSVEAPAVAGWQPLSVTDTAPPGTAGLTVRLYSMQGAIATTTWDDVTLRTSADAAYDPAVGTDQPVLFVGDQRVESYSGVTRVVHPGTKAGTDGSLFDRTGRPGWDQNPRLSGTVLPDPQVGYKMWYTTTDGHLGYAESPDGVAWTPQNPVPTQAVPNPKGFADFSPMGVVANPAWTSGSSLPRYFMLTTENHYYTSKQSTDGKTWTDVPGAAKIPGWDVANVTWDPVARLFVAMHKSVPVDFNPNKPASAPGTRTVWVSTSTDFKTWSPAQPVFAADAVDAGRITDPGREGTTPWSEIYGMPAVRYGDQYLGLPWVFDIAHSPYRDSNARDPGYDIGRSHLEIAASRDLVNWSRPERGNILTPGASGSWDYGFEMGGSTLINVGGRTRFYYGSFSGEHGCSDMLPGCVTQQMYSRIGMVSWPQDRFESFHAGADPSRVTTRPLTPAGPGLHLKVNFDPGTTGGSLRVTLLDAAGQPIPDYPAPSTAITADAPAPGAEVTWAGKSLPAGPFRLRFELTGGDLYAYTITG